MTTQRFVQNPWRTDEFSVTGAAATVSAATSYVVPSGASGRVEITFVAKDGSQNTIAGTVSHRFKNVSGALSLVGALANIEALAGDAALLAAVVDVTTSGTTIQPRITGIALTTIDWLLDVRYWVH